MMKLQLRKSIFRSEMQEGWPVRDHLREMREITEKLAAMQSPINDEDQVMTLLGSLPSSYDPLVATLGAQMNVLTMDAVERTLLDEEARREASGRQPSGAVAMFGGEAPKSSRQGKSQNSGRCKKPKDRLKCFKCKKSGHFYHECPQRSSGNNTGHRQAQIAADQDTGDVAFSAQNGKEC